MVPPFLAYYGVLTHNETLLQMAYDQCRLYRQYLVDDDAGGMWKHIVLGKNTDSGHWSTGAFILRPLAAMHDGEAGVAESFGIWFGQVTAGQRLVCFASSARSSIRSTRRA